MTHTIRSSIGHTHEDIPTPEFLRSLFTTLCLVPFFLGVFQIFIWSQYTLRGDEKRAKKPVVLECP
jgi:hypothetical protein